MFKFNELNIYLLKILFKSYSFLLIISIVFTSIKCQPPTIPQLKYYEILHNIDIKHNRIVKRSAETDVNQSNESVKHLVSFRSIDRDFNLLLTQNKDIISSDLKAYTVDSKGRKKPIFVDLRHHYSGTVEGIDGSDVRAHYDPDTGLMTASIHTVDETYEIEPIWRHSDSHKNNMSSMIVFKHSDLKHSNNNATEESKHFCDYIKIDENTTDEDILTHEKLRHKRDVYLEGLGGMVLESDWKPVSTHCAIILVADYYFFETMGHSDPQTTTNYLVHIIDRVNNIFMNTTWTVDQSKPGISGLGFFIKEIQIHEQFNEEYDHYNANRNRAVNELLELYSATKKNNQFCLAHLFTHRKFEGSVLGLAYVASPRPSAVGGICSPSHQKHGRNLYLNTGLTTTKNGFDKRIITREAVLVTAHEFGHNWGSEHDPHTEECSPSSGFGGPYVMYTYSVTGYDSNNKFFSPCSKRSIRAVLMSKSQRCFIKPEKSFCGNGLKEIGEECDEGLLLHADEYNMGLCCDNRCQLIAGAHCSDKNSMCCANCELRKAGHKCKDKDPFNCKQESICNGESDQCPDPKPLDDGVECLDRGKCLKGKCASLCASLGMRTCMCQDHRNACYRCCRQNYANSTCRPIEPMDPLPDGTPCHQGVCEKQRCEQQVQDFVQRFWDVIEDIDISVFWNFMKDNIVFAVIFVTTPFWILISVGISHLDRKEKEKQKKRSASFSSNTSGRRVSRHFSRKHSRPGFRLNNGVTVAHQTQRQINVYESVL